MDETKLTMDDFKNELDRSFHRLKENDIVRGTVIGVSDTQVIVDLSYYAEGIIKIEELSNDPRFSIKEDILVGDMISAMVIGEDKEGNILLSKKQAEAVLSWDELKELKMNKEVCTIKVAQVVNGGVITYLKGIRAFIPASMLDINYVENLEDYVGKSLAVIVYELDKEKNKLILSAKEVLRNQEQELKHKKMAVLEKGMVMTGTVEKIMPFGAFIKLSDGLSGLVHISQICEKRLKSPNEVLKEGQEVTVKIIDIKDNKLSLSMKAVESKDSVEEDLDDIPLEYSNGESASTNLSSLLKNIKL